MGKPKRKLSAHNKCMSHELKGKLSGKTEAQRKKIFSAAARKCSRETKKTSTSAKPKSRASPSRANPAGGNRRMTKNSFNMNKIYGSIRKIAIFLPAVGIVMGNGTPEQKMVRVSRAYFGVDPVLRQFNWNWLMQGWGPAFAAQVITRVPALINKIMGMF